MNKTTAHISTCGSYDGQWTVTVTDFNPTDLMNSPLSEDATSFRFEPTDYSSFADAMDAARWFLRIVVPILP